MGRGRGGVPVLDIKPKDWKENNKVLIYTHGGAYTLYSATSTLTSSAPVADATGREHGHVRPHRVDHLGHEHHRGDVAAVTAGLGALGGYFWKQFKSFKDDGGMPGLLDEAGFELAGEKVISGGNFAFYVVRP